MKNGLKLRTIQLLRKRKDLERLPESKLVINTINAHSYNLTRKDTLFTQALLDGDVLIPDGASIVMAVRLLRREKIQRTAGWDLFQFEMKKQNKNGGTCFFLGSSEKTLALIRKKISTEYPNIKVETYSPPYKKEFSDEENAKMIQEINAFQPNVLFIGMTAPKQEKWVYTNLPQLQVGHICCIGAVFDFYAGTVKRAPDWMIKIGMEWFYRLIREPKRMWKRYLIGNVKFIIYVCIELLKK